MFFKYLNKYITKIIALTLVLYIISSIFIISNAENYEWTVINNSQTVETNSEIEDGSSVVESNATESSETESVSSNSVTDELNLECESAILIEQTTRSNFV